MWPITPRHAATRAPTSPILGDVSSAPLPRRLLPLVLAVGLVGAACGSGERPELVAFQPTATPVPTVTPEPTPAPEPEPSPTPEAEVLPETEEREPAVARWEVVTTVDRLNLRAEPTTSAEILAELSPGQGGLEGTGETATGDGYDWVQLAGDDDRPTGWVAVDFLIAVEPEADAVDPRRCFHDDDVEATTVVIDFADADDETFTGGVRTVSTATITYAAVAGRRTVGGTYAVALRDLDASALTTDEWIAAPAGLERADASSVSAVDCAEIADLVSSIDLNVVDHPEAPPAP